MRDVRRTGSAGRPLRQPRRRPVDVVRGRRFADRSLGHGPRRPRRARRVRRRAGPRDGSVDGRDDRPDDGHRAPRPPAVDDVGDVVDGRARVRQAGTGGVGVAHGGAADRPRVVRAAVDRRPARVGESGVRRRGPLARRCRTGLRPRVQPGWHGAPVPGRRSLGSSGRAAPLGARADARHARRLRHAHRSERRPAHRRADPRRPLRADRGDGPRLSAAAVGAVGRPGDGAHRRNSAEARRS